MPYIILIRADNENAIQQNAVADYTRTPAEHLNLDNNKNWNNTGYVSTFRYSPNDIHRTPDNSYLPTITYSLNSGELAPYRNVHFIIINEDAFDRKIIALNGGTEGYDDDRKQKN